jgi:hypothetical protein
MKYLYVLADFSQCGPNRTNSFMSVVTAASRNLNGRKSGVNIEGTCTLELGTILE